MGQITELAKEIHQNAESKGFWFQLRTSGECIALMHSELSEALEAARQEHLQQDEHCPEFKNIEIEFADCIIRILDFTEAHGFDIEGAILAKMAYNKTRPFKHGKKF